MDTRSVTDFDQVVGELRHGAEGLGCLNFGRVVRDEKGLLGLDDNETFLALFPVLVFIFLLMYGRVLVYLLRLQCVRGRVDGHVLLAVDLDALQNHLLRIACVCEGVEDDLEFGLRNLVSELAHDQISPLCHCCGRLYLIEAMFRRFGVDAWYVWHMVDVRRSLGKMPKGLGRLRHR
jgi:hypothetical protein